MQHCRPPIRLSVSVQPVEHVVQDRLSPNIVRGVPALPEQDVLVLQTGSAHQPLPFSARQEACCSKESNTHLWVELQLLVRRPGFAE